MQTPGLPKGSPGVPVYVALANRIIGMTYAETVAHLNALVPELAPSSDPSRPPRRFDLADMRCLCTALDDPQTQVPAVLIAGTNGKGSTASTLASILTSAGYRTGLYTSPHLLRVTERIQLGHPVLPSEYGVAAGKGTVPGADGPIQLGEIPDVRFAELYTRVHEAGEALVNAGELPLAPSFFERLTAVAFLYFAEARANIMVLEVGLGGRLDATNVVDPVLSILTDVALDHQEYLGHTIAAITAEKCGILRAGGTLVTLPQHAEANQAIGEAAMRLGVYGINAADYLPNAERNTSRGTREMLPASDESEGPHYHPRQGQPSVVSRGKAPKAVQNIAPNRYLVTLGEAGQTEIESPLAGDHQRRNIALAIAAAVALRSPKLNDVSPGKVSYSISDDSIVAGIKATRWPGRLEVVAPNFLLDVAHNPAGAWTLRSALGTLPEEQPRTLIFSCLRDKDLGEMARILFPLFDSVSGDPLRRQDHIILAPIGSPRAAAVSDLLQTARDLDVPVHAAPHLVAAFQQARQITPAGGLIVATGSVYLVGEIRELALGVKAH